MKRILIFLISLILIATMIPSVFAEESSDNDEFLRTLPSSVDLTDYFPEPGSQGNLGSCTTWAVCYAAKSGSEYQKRGWTVGTDEHNFSPSYIYNTFISNPNLQLDVPTELNYIISNGVCTTAYFPYDVSGTQSVTSLQNKNAALYKALSCDSTTSLYQIKQLLFQGKGCIATIYTAPDFDNLNSSNDTYDDPSNLDTTVGHVICLIGYNDSKQAFKFINSWGSTWGIDGGYGWISYNLIGNSTVNKAGSYVTYYLNYLPLDNYMMGDVNNDGSITAADSRLALRYATGLESLTDQQKVLADVDGNSEILAADSRYILQYATGMINHFPLYD